MGASRSTDEAARSGRPCRLAEGVEAGLANMGGSHPNEWDLRLFITQWTPNALLELNWPPEIRIARIVKVTGGAAKTENLPDHKLYVELGSHPAIERPLLVKFVATGLTQSNYPQMACWT